MLVDLADRPDVEALPNEMYAGPVAERAKVPAARIAWSLNRRLSGTGARARRAAQSGGSNTKRRPVTSDGAIRT